MASILIQANAKINLDLKILGKRPDGFHQIESTFQSIDLSDFLLFEKSKKNFKKRWGVINYDAQLWIWSLVNVRIFY